MARPLGITSLQILAAIRDGATYGLEIVAHTGLPSGTVYPTLGRLKSRGQVRARWEAARDAERAGRPRRRYYELTPGGAEALAEGRERFSRAAARLSPEQAG
ncbi:MAG: PadR family transcriptional regulator [Gemmatimonadetes bacterium]|nr:PadR family transcriptional regulator [Gemmatimonadota bacterium]